MAANRLGLPWAFAVLVLVMVQHADGFSIVNLGQFTGNNGGVAQRGAACRRRLLQLGMMAVGSASKVGKAMKKPTGAMTVSFQVCSPAAKLGQTDLDALSMALRKNKAATVFAHSDVLAAVAREQATAKGNFPGPCPVVAWGAADVQAAVDAGASGIVLALGELGADKAKELAGQAEGKLDVLWEVTSAAEAAQAAEAGAAVVVAKGAALEDGAVVLAALPKGCVAVAAVEAMQAEAGEVGQAKSLKALGFHSILVEGACVGDGEDTPFVKWAVAEMSSKQSQEFKITGMTGHVNGHYGTGTFEKSQALVNWKRKQA